MPIHVRVHHRTRRVIVEIDGVLDAPAVEQCLAAYDRGEISGWKELDVMMRGVSALDSRGVELLLYLQERSRGWRLTLFGCGAGVVSLLREAGLDPRLDRAEPRPSARTASEDAPRI